MAGHDLVVPSRNYSTLHQSASQRRSNFRKLDLELHGCDDHTCSILDNRLPNLHHLCRNQRGDRAMCMVLLCKPIPIVFHLSLANPLLARNGLPISGRDGRDLLENNQCLRRR